MARVGPPQQRVIDYYRRPESRVAYALLLGGTRHFGWYPPGSDFHVMDYQRLGFADGSFDGASTMETLVHARDPAAVLFELHRVLAAGGRLALFEYSMAPRQELTARQRRLFDAITEESAMHALPGFVHGCFPGLLHAAGFRDVEVQDVSERMAPMLRRLARLLWLPYQLARAAGAQRRLVNAMAAVEADRHRVWRYNVVTAAKPYSSATV